MYYINLKSIEFTKYHTKIFFFFIGSLILEVKDLSLSFMDKPHKSLRMTRLPILDSAANSTSLLILVNCLCYNLKLALFL